ncbi:MAG TPA: DUF1127 domain-containing protein [Pseudolabrys sp.]|nr:DUF1127 domain-containing protein [Pseudolabrys sp.]
MTNIPVVPVAAGTLARALVALATPVTRWLKAAARARRNRRDASVLAGLDSRMLSDMGITRADLRDAFSEPFWQDPTALLQERSQERRQYRYRNLAPFTPRHREAPLADGFTRPATDRPARHAV